jgi:hypothetical protein
MGMKIELTKEEIWTLIEVLNDMREAIEHLGDEEDDAQLEALENKLREELKEALKGTNKC